MGKKPALLVIDVQSGLFEEQFPVYDGEGMLGRIGGLIGRARALGIPVIYVQHNEGLGEPLETGSPNWQIHPAVAPAESEPVIQKRYPDSFRETNLQEELHRLEIDRLVIAGLQTDFCVNETARRAGALGYEVTVAADAHSSSWDPAGQDPASIHESYNEAFREFADVRPSSDIAFV